MKPFPTPNDCHFSPWTGCAPLHIETWQGINKLIVGVHCKIEKANIENIALLDTAAEWSIIGGKLAEKTLEDKTLSIPAHIPITLSTRLGKFTGNVHRIAVSLLAEQGRGHDLEVDGSFIVMPDWKGPMVLGFHGFLERILFAIDHGVSSQQPGYIYFARP